MEIKMRLTEEEKRIADDISIRCLDGRAGAPTYTTKDAWRHALSWIAARREAFGGIRQDPVKDVCEVKQEESVTPTPPTFEDELGDLIKRHGIDSDFNTPFWALSRYLVRSLEAHRLASETRSAEWPAAAVAVPTTTVSNDEVVTDDQRSALMMAIHILRQHGHQDSALDLGKLLAALDAAKLC